MSRFHVAALCTVFILGLVPSTSQAQLAGVYEFDAGGDGTSWDDAFNWERVADPNGLPLSGNPVAPPDSLTSAEIPFTGVVIDSTMPGQTALDVRVGTTDGAGSMIISGGDLSLRDLFVGADPGVGANPGTVDVTGGILDAGDDITLGGDSAGFMTISNGMVSTADDFNVGLGSSLTMTGGTLDVGDRLITSDDANILIDGGMVIGGDDFQFFGDAQVTVESGLMVVRDKLYFDTIVPAGAGKLTINGGVVRSEEYGVEGNGRGPIEINGDGVFQVLQSQLSIAEALMLIASGIEITTSELAQLQATSVVVADFFGQSDLTFTQISIIPEPGSALLILLGLMGLRLSGTRSNAV